MTRRISIVLAAILGVYIVFTVSRGVDFLNQPEWTVKVLGLSVIVISALGIYLIAREIRFGQHVAQMTTHVDFMGSPDRGAILSESECLALYDEAAHRVHESPDDWQAWYLLAIAYDTNRDRRRARESMRTALNLYLSH